jgi:hypothetical protein
MKINPELAESIIIATENAKISEYLPSILGDEEIKEDKPMKRFEIAMLTAQAE